MNETSAEEEEKITKEYDDMFVNLVNYEVDDDTGEILDRKPVQDTEQQTSETDETKPEPSNTSIKDEDTGKIKERAAEQDYYVDIDFASLRKGE